MVIRTPDKGLLSRVNTLPRTTAARFGSIVSGDLQQPLAGGDIGDAVGRPRADYGGEARARQAAASFSCTRANRFDIAIWPLVTKCSWFSITSSGS